MLSNLKAQTVSTEAIERLLIGSGLTGPDLDTVYSWQFRTSGHKFYVLTIKDMNITLAFDLVERRWCQWTDGDGNYLPIVSSTFDSAGRHILQHESNGKLYYATMDYFTDDSTLIPVDVYTPNFDAGARLIKYLPWMGFVADQYSGSFLDVRYSEDDYQTWSSYRRVDLGQKNPDLRDEGSFYRRAYHLRHRCNTPLRIQAIDLDLKLGLI